MGQLVWADRRAGDSPHTYIVSNMKDWGDWLIDKGAVESIDGTVMVVQCGSAN